MNRHYTVIGISNRPGNPLPAGAATLLPVQSVFSGGDRHYALVRPFLPEPHTWIPIKGNMTALFEAYHRTAAPTLLIFASGDPLFYGMVQTIRQYDPCASISLLSSFNSIQLLCARIGQPYQHVKNASVHGRSWRELDTALLEGEPLIAVLTDALHDPAAIARRLLDYGFTDYELIVGEDLEGDNERIRHFQPGEAIGDGFHPLNCVLLRQTPSIARQQAPAQHQPAPTSAQQQPAPAPAPAPHPRTFGLEDHLFESLPGRPHMITKRPLRLLTLSVLQLQQARVFWDIGFCTGSLSIEARRLFPHLRIHAFERRAECAGILQRNMQRLSAPGIDSHIGDFFDQDLDSIPAPDAVFVGGHGGRLPALLEKIHQRIKTGIIAFNAVLDTSREQFIATAQLLGWQLSTSDTLTINDHNPVTLLVAHKTNLQPEK
jgi:precorrin-6B C5,15-methyltransferase / cobalt-precorrin-6B C5,C15-methyltransferase